MINIISPINQLGYGIAGFNILKNLPEVSLWPIGQIQITSEEDANIVRKALSNAVKPDFYAPCIRIWHQHDMSQFVGKGDKIGFPFFELNEFSDIEKHHLSYLDKIFVTSEWAKQVILDQISILDNKVSVIPLGVDIDIFKPQEQNTSEKTIFFNCGKWEIRKGHDIIVEAFNKAFTNQDNVELWMMCENPFLNEEQEKSWINLYKNSKLGDKIKIIKRTRTQNEVYNIMCQADCGVFPARAEGWNLELLEMMACGKSVITTKYSAHLEFCNNNNSYLIDIDEDTLAYDGIWFHGKIGKWAKIGSNQIDNIVTHMKNIHKLKNMGELKINQNGIETAHKYTWKNSAQMVLKYV
jgi:glycosyltransferase involved in cell wall biosynthesis